MKQFLYMDLDLVNSIIAQSSKGLVNQRTLEHDARESNTNGIENEIEGNGSVGGGKLIKQLFDAEAKVAATHIGTHQTENETYSKEVLTTTLHDAAFDMAYDLIKPEKISGIDADPGTYIELTEVFDFIDLEYLLNLFSDDGIIDFIKSSEKSNATDRITNPSKKQEASHKINEKYNYPKSVITALKSVIPYKRMLSSYDGYLIPLEDKCFRVNPSTIGFTYGGEIHCVGLVTNIIGESTDPEVDPNDPKNFAIQLQFSINEMIRSLIPTKEKDILVINPIAIYYDIPDPID